jgi:ABC-type branched-subunit amino acid transport system ATPase component
LHQHAARCVALAAKPVQDKEVMLLEAKHLTRRFGGLVAVNDASLTVAQGEIVGLIGPNGAGKTTLFNLLSGFLQPDEGDVLLDGSSIVGLKPHQICHLGMSRTFQIVRPFPEMTVLDNVMMGAFKVFAKAAKASEKALSVLELVDFRDWADRRAGDLPVAGRKRLEIAKVLATEPRIILLDEVMAGLTPSEHNQIINIVRRIRDGGVTIVVIEHVMPVIMNLSDRIYVLHHGQMIAQGRPEEIVRDPAVVEAYLGEDIAL